MGKDYDIVEKNSRGDVLFLFNYDRREWHG